MDFARLSGLARVKERTKQVAEREVHWGAERMTQSETIVTAWNNGAHHSSGAGYGVKLTIKDRDAYLRREWGRVEIYLPGRANPTKVNVEKDSLWGRQCRELISHEIGKWLLATGMPRGQGGCPQSSDSLRVRNARLNSDQSQTTVPLDCGCRRRLPVRWGKST